MANLDEMIRYCDEVAEKQKDFDNFQCDYCKAGCEDGGNWGIIDGGNLLTVYAWMQPPAPYKVESEEEE